MHEKQHSKYATPAYFLILCLAASLRLFGLASRSVWYDEAIEYWTAVVPFTDLFHVVSTSMHDPPLYSFLLNLWFMIGIDELWARLPAFYASMIALAGILHIGRKYYGWKVGLVAGLFFAISAADIRYAQEIGQYSLMICLTVWNFHFLLRATQQRKLYDWLLWGGTAALSLYTHYGSAIIIFTTSTTALGYLAYHRHWRAIVHQVATGIVVILSLIPIFVFIMPTQMGRLGAEPLAINFREFVAISSRILAFPIVSNGGFYIWSWATHPIWAVALLMFLLLIAALVRARSLLHPTIFLLISWLGYYFGSICVSRS